MVVVASLVSYTVVYREPRGSGPVGRPDADPPLQPEPEPGAEPHRHLV